MKCTWAKDTQGFYLTPLIGYSKTPKLGRAVWIGWLWWLFTLSLERRSE